MKIIYQSLSSLFTFNLSSVKKDIKEITVTQDMVIDCPQELNISQMRLANQGVDIIVTSTEKGRDITIETLILDDSATIRNDSNKLLHIGEIYVNNVKVITQPYYNVSYIACKITPDQCYIIITSNTEEGSDQTQVFTSGNVFIESI